MKNIMDEMNGRNITVGIPTYKRVSSVNNILLSICDVCTIEALSLLVVDDDPDTANTKIIDAEVEEILDLRGYAVLEVKNKDKHGVTGARNCMLRTALEIGSEHIVYFDDDANPKAQCIERLVALQIQEPRIAVSATVGNYTKFYSWREFKRDSVRFHTSLGIAYSFLASAVKEVGFQNEEIAIRADHEYNLRMWSRGYWTAAVRAPVAHKRFATRDDGGALPRNKSDEWGADARLIASIYPELVRISKGNWNIITKFKYPATKLELDDNLVLWRDRV